MRNRLVIRTLLLLVFSSVLISHYKLQIIKARTIVVPDDYATIQEAINAAAASDIIYVKKGTYTENIVVNQSVSIYGEDKYATIVDGDRTDTVFHIEAGSVTISGFTIQNGVKPEEETWTGGVIINGVNNVNVVDNIFINNSWGIRVIASKVYHILDNLFENNMGGIFLGSSSQGILRNNRISRCIFSFGVEGRSLDAYMNDIDTTNTVDGKPIYYFKNQRNLAIEPTSYPNIGYLALINSTNITIRDLSIKNNYQGVLMAFTTNSVIANVSVQSNFKGICLQYSHGNILQEIMALNNGYGLSLHFSCRNILISCFLTQNEVGMYVGAFMSQPPGCTDNLIIGNTFYNNNWLGLYFVDAGGNTIVRNNFISNVKQIEEMECFNIWHNGAEGNHWSDYTGQDLNGDGIGDTNLPHLERDYYPLINPYIIGDLNHDQKVSLSDLVVFAKAYGSKPNDPNWNPFADLNEDDSVNLLDLVMLAQHYGKKWSLQTS